LFFLNLSLRVIDMASHPPPQPQQVWSDLGLDDNKQRELLDQLVNVPDGQWDEFFVFFKQSPAGNKVGELSPFHFKSMFDPEYLVSLGATEESKVKIRTMAEATSKCDHDSLPI
jgi:hypothetical protein